MLNMAEMLRLRRAEKADWENSHVNCISFVFYILGLQEKEDHVEPDDPIIEQHFETVQLIDRWNEWDKVVPEDARVFGFKNPEAAHSRKMPYYYGHLALLPAAPLQLIIERAQPRCPVEYTTVRRIVNYNSRWLEDSGQQLVFMKQKAILTGDLT